MAAVPDFAAGAMENWGLITYREADLLIDPKKTSASSKYIDDAPLLVNVRSA